MTRNLKYTMYFCVALLFLVAVIITLGSLQDPINRSKNIGEKYNINSKNASAEQKKRIERSMKNKLAESSFRKGEENLDLGTPGMKFRDGRFYNQKDYDEGLLMQAIGAFSSAIEFNPNYKEAYFKRAISKKYIGDMRGAIVDFNKYMEFELGKEDQSVVHLNLGLIKEELKNFDGAIAEYNTVINHQANQDDVQTAYYRLGGIQSSKGDVSGAIEYYNKCAEVGRISLSSRCYLARGLERINQGDTDIGCIDLSQAIDHGDSNALDYLEEYCN